MASLSVLTINSETRRRRIRLAISMALYGGALGAAAIIISLLNRGPFDADPERLRLIDSVYVSLGGGIAGVLVALPLGYFMGAASGTRPSNLLRWWVVGIAFGVALPFATGAVVPFTLVFEDLSVGLIRPGQVIGRILDAVFRAPLNLILRGALGIFTGLLAGAIFGTGGWVADMFNASSKPVAAKVGPLVVAIILGSVAVVIAVFGSPDALAKLG